MGAEANPGQSIQALTTAPLKHSVGAHNIAPKLAPDGIAPTLVESLAIVHGGRQEEHPFVSAAMLRRGQCLLVQDLRDLVQRATPSIQARTTVPPKHLVLALESAPAEWAVAGHAPIQVIFLA